MTTAKLTEPLLHDLAEVAQTLRLGLSTVRALVASGKLRSVKIGDRRLVRREDLLAFIESASQAA